MKEDSSTKCWNKQGRDWCELAQNNDFRMHYLMPFTFKILGEMSNKKILALGCGEGGYARELSKKNAEVVCVDCNAFFIEYASKKARENNLSIQHLLRNSNDLYGIKDSDFDVVLCSMMLMDCEDLDGTLKEAYRVLKTGGILIASILHPCFTGKNVRSKKRGTQRTVIIENYYEPKEWEDILGKGFKFPVIYRHRTLQDYVKAFIKANFVIKDLHEPQPNSQQVKIGRLVWLSRIPMFLFWELRKP